MSAFSKLVPEGKRACNALEKATPWPKEEWARSVRTLERAGLFPTIGLEQVIALVTQTRAAPDDVAQLLVSEAAKVKAGTVVERAPHEESTVCSSSTAYIGPLEMHACKCRRLTDHPPTHECACGGIW